MSELERDLLQLHRYHDGELSGFERLLFERRLRRSPALRGELQALRGVSALIAQAAPDSLSASAPDLWSGIASALPAIDAQVADERAGSPAWVPPAKPAEPAGWPKPWFGLPGWAAGAGALAAAAAVALAVIFQLQLPDAVPGAQLAGAAGVVRYLDSGDASVMVIEDAAADMTIVWMMEAV